MSTTIGTLLRIFIDEEDRWHGKVLSHEIVQALREAGFAGATVLKGIEGYGIHRKLHSSRTVEYSGNLPVLIEVIADPAKIEQFLPTLKEMVAEGLLTLERVHVLRLSRKDG